MLFRSFMEEALKLAREAFLAGEVPVGAVIVCNGKIIGKGRNHTEENRDPTGAISQAIAENPVDLPKYTWTNNLVGVISDGSAILGVLSVVW